MNSDQRYKANREPYWSVLALKNNVINKQNEHGNVPLHEAIVQNNMKLLDELLHHNHIELNIKNYKGETPLLLALRMSRPYSCIMKLIKAGGDVNSTNRFGQNPLHVALLCSTLQVLHELIKSGANVNLQDSDKRTPLHYAIDNNNLEAVCMLLYYEADVSMCCKDKETPLNLALYSNRSEIAEVLVNYYEDFSDPDIDGYTSLHLAITQQSPLAKELVNAGADVNYVTFDKQTSLMATVEAKNIELFELIWPKFNHELLLGKDALLFLQCMQMCNSSLEFLKLMYLILESPKAVELIEEFNNYSTNSTFSCGSFEYLLGIFDNFKINSNDRIKMISAFLSLGAEIGISDINITLIRYGFNEELEMFLYGTEFYSECRKDSIFNISLLENPCLYPQCLFIFSIKKDVNFEIVADLLQSIINRVEQYNTDEFVTLNCILNNFSFFSIPFHKKQELLEKCRYPIIRQKIESLPEIPSLVELSRNQARNFIKQRFNVTKAYQFHDIVKRLPLPILIRDILRFKTPIYL